MARIHLFKNKEKKAILVVYLMEWLWSQSSDNGHSNVIVLIAVMACE